MLRDDPRQRLDASGVCSRFKKILEESKAKTLTPIPASIMSALLEIDEEAPSKLQYSSEVKQQIEALETAHDRKSRKSIVLNPPLKRTAQRSEYLKAALSSASSKGNAPVPAVETHQVTKDRLFHHPPFRKEPAIQNVPPPAADHTNTATDLSMQRQGRPRENTIPRPHKPQDVFKARKQIEQMRKRSFGNPIPKKEDPILSKYISERDIVSMEICWSSRPNRVGTDLSGRQRGNNEKSLGARRISVADNCDEDCRSR